MSNTSLLLWHNASFHKEYKICPDNASSRLFVAWQNYSVKDFSKSVVFIINKTNNEYEAI